MITRFKEERLEYKIITLAVLAAALFFVCKIIYAGIIALPYPKEVQEASNVALTNTFLSGRSPYTLSALNWDVPGVNYDYPFLNSLVAAAVAKITQCNAVTAHFFVSLVSILLSGLLGAAFVNGNLKTTIGQPLAAIMFMFCHWRYGYISAAPDDLGLFILLLTAYVAVSPKIKNKPLICAIGITLCFYTKQYLVFISAAVFVYMLLYSWKDAVKLFAWTVLINAVIAVVISIFWPLYWTKAFLFTYVGTAIGGGGEVSTLVFQLKYILVMFAALFVVTVISAALELRKIYMANKSLRGIRVRENDVFAMSAVSSVVMLIPLLVLGRNDGAMFSYFLQLWMPFVTVVAIICFEKMIPDIPDGGRRNFIYAVVYMLIAASTVYFGFGKLPVHILTRREIDNWQKAYEYTEQYSRQGDIFYSRGLAYDGFARANGEWMCGHEGEPDEESEVFLAKWGITPETYPYVHMIVQQNAAFRQRISEKAKEHGYSLIIFETDDRFIPFNEEKCARIGYRCIDRLDLQFGNMAYEVVFYACE